MTVDLGTLCIILETAPVSSYYSLYLIQDIIRRIRSRYSNDHLSLQLGMSDKEISGSTKGECDKLVKQTANC